jgi:ankyrin repeat protein
MAEISLPCFKRQLLLKANVNLKTKNCLSTPLHRAAYMCHENIIELLLDSGAEPQEQDCDGRNALHKCIENRNKKFIQCANLLVKHCPTLLNMKDKNEKISLDYCQDLKDIF